MIRKNNHHVAFHSLTRCCPIHCHFDSDNTSVRQIGWVLAFPPFTKAEVEIGAGYIARLWPVIILWLHLLHVEVPGPGIEPLP